MITHFLKGQVTVDKSCTPHVSTHKAVVSKIYWVQCNNSQDAVETFRIVEREKRESLGDDAHFKVFGVKITYTTCNHLV